MELRTGNLGFSPSACGSWAFWVSHRESVSALGSVPCCTAFSSRQQQCHFRSAHESTPGFSQCLPRHPGTQAHPMHREWESILSQCPGSAGRVLRWTVHIWRSSWWWPDSHTTVESLPLDLTGRGSAPSSRKGSLILVEGGRLPGCWGILVLLSGESRCVGAAQVQKGERTFGSSRVDMGGLEKPL